MLYIGDEQLPRFIFFKCCRGDFHKSLYKKETQKISEDGIMKKLLYNEWLSLFFLEILGRSLVRPLHQTTNKEPLDLCSNSSNGGVFCFFFPRAAP